MLALATLASFTVAPGGLFRKAPWWDRSSAAVAERAAIFTLARVAVVLLAVCTPTGLDSWPVDAQVLLDCADHERRRLSVQAGPYHVGHVVRDGSEYQMPGLPVLDSPGRLPAAYGLLLDCKATTTPTRLGSAEIGQLVGYLLLDYDDQYRITHVGLYLSRQGAVIVWEVSEFFHLLGARTPLPQL